ncbi:ARID-like protein [Rhizopus microsporus]|uniref:ARID-like protein n=1 Tax=Rhizopus microsporus TaxID=58291 RepID=A0A1X0SDG8_RHIZD|nr:ARID-like protein [Rhizopus microsporus]
MSKVVIDTIERTKEYNNFIEQLKAFHARKGTTLLSEPVLGGKKIDLHKLFKDVIAAGGFEQVTKKRSWKQIGDGFDLPATCTNSAYILKGLYIRNLVNKHIYTYIYIYICIYTKCGIHC